MGLWKSLAGSYVVEIISASPAEMLTAINNFGIHLFDVIYINDLCIRAGVYKLDFKSLRTCIEKRGEKVKITNRVGLYWAGASFIKRPVLVTGLIIFLLLVLYLPTRVLFICVEGNQSVPTQLIMEQVQACGIRFATSRREVRSEKVKNALLSAIPQLQWAGVNTTGCVAVISVRERSIADELQQAQGVSSIVAARDGIIKEITVLNGNALCTVGQAVKAGQVLVSGYTDCGIYIKGVRADAEVIAQTSRDVEALMPAKYIKRGDVVATETRYYLKVGKNIIKFCKDSGISDGRCVKMYKQRHLALPGDFCLPVTLVAESIYFFDVEETLEDENELTSRIIDASAAYLRTSMLAGKILDSNVNVNVNHDFYYLSGQYLCLEMIGKTRNEGIV